LVKAQFRADRDPIVVNFYVRVPCLVSEKHEHAVIRQIYFTGPVFIKIQIRKLLI